MYYLPEYGRHVARRHRLRHRRAPAHAIYTANHVYHEKRVAWYSISMHAFGCVMVAFRSTGAPLLDPKVSCGTQKRGLEHTVRSKDIDRPRLQ